MMDNRTLLVRKLVEMMPHKTPSQPDNVMAAFESEPIRRAAEAFAHVIEYELPKDRTELIALLWVFGEILDGDMRKMVARSERLSNDLLSAYPSPSYLIKK
jgi:hypothetical protein